MKIGLFVDMYYPRISGVVTSAMVLKDQLTKLGHTVYVFTTSDPDVTKKEKNVFRMPSVPLYFLPDTHRMAFFYPPYMLYKTMKLKLDIIHTYTEFTMGFFGKFISKMQNIPMVHTYHTMYEDYVYYVSNGRIITKETAQRFSRIFCNAANLVIAPTDVTHQYLEGIGVKRNIRTIPTGLDFAPFGPTRFTPIELAKGRTELGLCLDDKVICTIGRVAKEKSIDVLIDAMPKVLSQEPNAKLLIVGDGPAREALQAQARTLGIERAVVFAGFRPWSEIAKYYVLSDVFATPSTTETQGLTYIEAMASRIPVVVKKADSFERYVRDGDTGYVFETDDDCADCLLRALSDPNSDRIVLNAFAAVQPLSAEVFGLELVKAYHDAINIKNRLIQKTTL